MTNNRSLLHGALYPALAALVLALACSRSPRAEQPVTEEPVTVETVPEAAPAADVVGEIEEPPSTVIDFVAAPRAIAPRSVLALQTAATTEAGTAAAADGRRVEVRLTNLAPWVGSWYLLRVDEPARAALELPHAEFHLQVADRRARLELFEHGVIFAAGDRRSRCALWGPDSRTLAEAAAGQSGYTKLCDGALYLRRTVSGHRTSKEWVADFLRDRVPGGEQVTTFVKEEMMKDAFLRTAAVESDAGAEHERPRGAPAPPRLTPVAQTGLFRPTSLDLRVETDDPQERLLVGRWYAVKEAEGIFVSGLEPDHVAAEVVREQGNAVSPLDEVEAKALTYLVAFDLDRLDVDFALGTDHPRVGWSERALPAVVNTRLPGPDGFDGVEPLARTGRIPPYRVHGVVATFIAGFKRSHGAFKHGRLAEVNNGTHYGFVEDGVILSSLQPGLATAVVWRDGTMELKTWAESDDRRLGEVRHARQNGVPILEPDESGAGRPGALVRKWGEGNWSGSQDQKFRTLRAGLCLQDGEAGRFLVYGYFSSVTTSAMARVFAAYGCGYAMLLDMNALEHTYLALYERSGEAIEVHHLDRGMSVLDQTFQGVVVPRFLGYPDNRDFFYVSRKSR